MSGRIFFFQAEDGIRDLTVTGVQTCALPILPHVTGLDGPLAQQLIVAAGLTVAQVESVQAAAAPGVTMLTRPAATTLLAPGAPVTVVVSRGAPTIAGPGLLGLSQSGARTRLEPQGLP